MNTFKKSALTISLIAGLTLLAGCELNSNENSMIKEGSESAYPVNFESYGMTSEEYVRYESDINFDFYANKQPAINEFIHMSKPVTVEGQVVVRSNNDTLYSVSVVDAREGFTISLPDTGERYQSAYVIDRDHYPVGVFYGEGTYEVEADTDFVMVVIRTQVNPYDAADIKEVVNIVQPNTTIDSKSNNAFEMSKFDKEQVIKLRAELDLEMAKIGSFDGTMDVKGKVDPWKHILGASSGWGLLPSKDASYIYGLVNQPETGCYKATYKAPPVNGFWSITMYDKDSMLFTNTDGILNGYNVEYNEDGSFDAHFGSKEDCGDIKNRLEITEGWNYLMRFYQPRLNELAEYKLPEITKVN